LADPRPYREPVKYFLDPGYLYLATQPTLISTVLGSCVSICLWDSKKEMGGMNHFIYPWATNGDQATTRFGNIAISLLIKMMLDEGASRSGMEAQIYGGARPICGIATRMGEENVIIARRTLKNHGIKIISEDVEGHLGRKVIFNTFTGEAIVLKVRQLRKTDWRCYP
jgi:chemotaxis protein CheD